MSNRVIHGEMAWSILGKRPRPPCTGPAWGDTTSKWTSLFLGNVLPLENVWPHWQLPSQWRSWSPRLIATIHSRSSTPKPPGRGLVSIFPQRSPTHVLRGKQQGRKVTQAGKSSLAALLVYILWEGASRSNLGSMLYVSILLEKWTQASSLLPLCYH